MGRTGKRASGLRVSGKRAGIRASGIRASGKRAGIRASGLRASGKRAGNRASGFGRLGVRAAGVRAGSKRAAGRLGLRVHTSRIRGIRAYIPAEGAKRSPLRHASAHSIRKLGIRAQKGQYFLVSPTGELAVAARGRYTLDDGSILAV
jgi:hypothetical protein